MADTVWQVDGAGFNDAIARAGDFVDIGIPLFDSEDVTLSLLEIYLALCATGWRAASSDTPMPLDGTVSLYMHGMWLPCVPRVGITGQIDQRNDGLYDWGCLPLKGAFGEWSFTTARRVHSVPRGWAFPGVPAASYLCGIMYRNEHDKYGKHKIGDEPLTYDGWYFGLANDRLRPYRYQDWPNQVPAAGCARFAAAALQAVAEFSYLWTVRTEEQPIGGKISTPMHLGVDAEMVKSLFYARNLPVTESGRRRPILHWVRAHQRRIKDGIDIDVRKHLRGVSIFEMDGFPFEITNPFKGQTEATNA